jgi:hypothetical protein
LRQFRFGFQRLWERVAWGLNVRRDVTIKAIERDEQAGIVVTYEHPLQMLGETSAHTSDRAAFDYLILACPLVKQQLQSFLTLSDEESQLTEKIQFIPYAVASYEVADVTLPERGVFHLPLPPRGWPMIAYQAHPDNELMAFYARLPEDAPLEDSEQQLRERIEQYVSAFGGRIRDDDDWHSYDAWLYFKHVTPDEMQNGYFDRWEQQQGRSRTFYVGGLFDFDYVEGIARYSRQLVETHFVGKRR